MGSWNMPQLKKKKKKKSVLCHLHLHLSDVFTAHIMSRRDLPGPGLILPEPHNKEINTKAQDKQFSSTFGSSASYGGKDVH